MTFEYVEAFEADNGEGAELSDLYRLTAEALSNQLAVAKATAM